MSNSYYDRIARKWHQVTGARGGAVKRLLLNDLVLGGLDGIAGRAILELGAGNGYFMPLVLRRFSGQVPTRIVITDQSSRLLDLARRHFHIPGADYRVLDVRKPLPFSDRSFDVVVAGMLFNELARAALHRGLKECRRVLSETGRLVATVTHPDFVAGLARRGELRCLARDVQTMPGAEGLRLPVVPRTVQDYVDAIEAAGFRVSTRDVHATDEVLAVKPGLRHAGRTPVALLLCCEAGPAAPPGRAEPQGG